LDTLLFKYLWLAFTMAALAKNAAEPHMLRGKVRNSDLAQHRTAGRNAAYQRQLARRWFMRRPHLSDAPQHPAPTVIAPE
jgi:hypothetical protein